MAIAAIVILLSIAHAVLGNPIGVDAFYGFNNGLSSSVVSRFLTIVACHPAHFLATVGPEGTQIHSNRECPLGGRDNAS